MAKLNRPVKAKNSRLREHKDATVNEEGGLAFKMGAKAELYTRVLTSLVGEKQFYDQSGKAKDKAILRLIKQVSDEDPEFILKLAAYTRNEMYLRSVPQVLLVEATAYDGTKQFVRKYTPSVVRRADELTEVGGYYRSRFGPLGKMSNPLKRGLADAFHQFDAYQFAKYDRDGPVKLKDMLKVCHPKPKDKEQSKMWEMLRDRTLPTPKTWEVELSVKGASKETWEGIFPKMGYMALLRNLDGFIRHKVDLKPVLKRITDPEQVKRSKQLPFRFYSAYKHMEHNSDIRAAQKVSDALQTALEISVENLPEVGGVSFIASDCSGSMCTTLSQKSSVQLHEISNLFAALGHKVCEEAIIGVFAGDFETIMLSKADGVLTNLKKLEDRFGGGATNAWKTIKWLNKTKEKVDRIILFSDMQCYSTDGGFHPYIGDRYGINGQSLAEQFEEYKARVNSKCILYSIDLAGYGTAQFPKDDGSVVLLAGFSERLLEFIDRYESRGEDAISAIQAYEPQGIRIPKFWFSQEGKGVADDVTEDIVDTAG